MLAMSKPTSECTVVSQVPECINVSPEKPVWEANKAGTVRKRNNAESSRNHCCREKAISIIYSARVSVTFVIQHAKRMRRIVMCGLSGSTTFSHVIS